MESGKRVVRGPHRIYLQTPENGTILLGVQVREANVTRRGENQKFVILFCLRN